jgi:HSP90 family molecular chaperone
MGKYINKSKGHKGRIRIGIITKERSRTIEIEHIGVGNNEEEVKMYMEKA